MSQFDTIVQRTIKLIRQVAGSSVQTYSQPLIEDMVNQAFDFVNAKRFWDQYTRWSLTNALNGTTGIIVNSLKEAADEIITWADIEAVLPDEGSDKKLPHLPKHVNPARLTGTRAMYIEGLPASHPDFATHVIQFWPKASTGNFSIRHRYRPKPIFIDDDEIHFDELMMVYAATYLYLKDDGAVPDMVDEYKTLFDIRFRDITMNEDGNTDIPIRDSDKYPSRNAPITEWH